ncbi:hypothetical protein ACLOJK_018008 [Asimina triloba]
MIKRLCVINARIRHRILIVGLTVNLINPCCRSTIDRLLFGMEGGRMLPAVVVEEIGGGDGFTVAVKGGKGGPEMEGLLIVGHPLLTVSTVLESACHRQRAGRPGSFDQVPAGGACAAGFDSTAR